MTPASLATLAELRPGSPAQVATALVVREDSLTLFGFADEAVAVNPSAKLRRVAEARGWPVLDWRR